MTTAVRLIKHKTMSSCTVARSQYLSGTVFFCVIQMNQIAVHVGKFHGQYRLRNAVINRCRWNVLCTMYNRHIKEIL